MDVMRRNVNKVINDMKSCSVFKNCVLCSKSKLGSRECITELMKEAIEYLQQLDQEEDDRK